MTKPYIRVEIQGTLIVTSIEEIAECISELDNALKLGTAENSDINCIYKALEYLKKYKYRDPRIIDIIRMAEAMLRRDIEQGRIQLW